MARGNRSAHSLLITEALQKSAPAIIPFMFAKTPSAFLLITCQEISESVPGNLPLGNTATWVKLSARVLILRLYSRQVFRSGLVAVIINLDFRYVPERTLNYQKGLLYSAL